MTSERRARARARARGDDGGPSTSRSRSRSRSSLVLLAFVLALPLASAGGEDERYSDFADATGYHTQAKMARAADGTLYAVYVEPVGDGNATDLVVLKGDEQLPRVQGARGDLSRPSLALAADGTLFLAWTERADEDREVFAARFVSGAWTDIIKLSNGAGYAGFPSLAAGADGAMHVAWYGFDGTFYQTYYRRWTQGAWEPADQLSSGPLDANNPSVVVAPDGAVHVAWYKDEGRRYSVWHARRSPAGAWELPERLPGTEGDALNVALAVDGAGVVHAAWDVRLANASHRVAHAVLSADGWSAPATLAEGPEAGEYPAIARWGEGVLVVWADADGALRATDTTTPARPFLGGTMGRHPSLRGPTVVDSAPSLDAMWAQDEGEEGYEIHFASLQPGCDWPVMCAAPSPSPTPSRSSVPLPWAFLALAACLAALLRRRGHMR